jgi:Protein of unknown function (DUF499)
MPSLRTIFETCRPRADVKAGTTKDEQFAADLAQVVNGTAPKEYSDPDTFFRHSYPTRGMKDLLKAVLQRLTGQGGEIASIIRLDTQYGGGKTHSLIALVHAVRGMKNVKNAQEFVDTKLLPNEEVKVAALDGENADPANGLLLEPGLYAKSIWGELAYRLAGAKGYRRVQESDEKHAAPGAETLRELFGVKPTLIMLDEVSVYLRKIEQVHPGSANQFTAFLQALLKAVETSPNVALVFTLAVGKDAEAKDAYKEEHERALAALAEAEMVASRKATQLNPTEEDETADVLRRRLFDDVERSAADEIVASYAAVWSKNQLDLPSSVGRPEARELFRRGYPLHPETMSVLTEKLSSLSTFHRTRGMLRLLARTVHVLWRDKPADALAIHPHHIDLGFGPIRDEITTRLGQGEYAPALKTDVAAVKGDDPAMAQQLDLKFAPGQLPIHSYIARTIFLHTLAFGDSAKGIATDQLKLAVCSPTVEPSFIEQARIRFITESLFLDDRPGALLRFMVEPNLTQVIRRQMDDIESSEVRSELNERIRDLFGAAGGAFNLVPFPAGPYEVEDVVGDGRPNLAVLHHDANAISADPLDLPAIIGEIVQFKGADRRLRELKNNLVFVMADERLIKNMKDKVRRRLALRELEKPERIRLLAEHQEIKVKEEYQKSKLSVAIAILHCYRHLFFPHNSPMPGTTELIAHAAIEVHNAGDSPGNGQLHVCRVLRDHHKLLGEGDTPEAPTYVRDQTPLKQKGELSTLDLRNEYRRAPKLSMLISDNPLIACIRQGVESEVFIYREGNQVWGKGDPSPAIKITESGFVHTLSDAKKKHLWPRAQPLALTLAAAPREIPPGGTAELTATVTGGVGPYTFVGSDPGLSQSKTTQTVLQCDVSPETSLTYQVEVTDARGQRQIATAEVYVAEPGKTPPPPKKPDPSVTPPKPALPPKPDLNAEGPLAQALTELFEKARKAKVAAVSIITIRFYDASATWKVHQAMATFKDAEITCRFEADISAEGIETFRIEFDGKLEKANSVKSFLDPQLRSATDHDFTATYALTFPGTLATTADKSEAFTKSLSRYGSGEAYVEAHAAPMEAKS